MSVALAASLLVCAFVQDPAGAEPAASAGAPAPGARFERVIFPSREGFKIVGDLYRAHADPATPFLVLFHEARTSRGEFREIAPRLNDLGYNCLAVDLRVGKGVHKIVNLTARQAERSGKETSLLDALKDVEDALAFARENYAKGKLVVWGNAFSAALALVVAGTPDRVDGVVAFAPAEYFENLGKGPTWIRACAGQVRCPVFVTSARADADWRPIFEALPTEAKTAFLPEVEGHRGSEALWSKTAGSDEYWRAIEAFLKRHFPPPAEPRTGD